ncbi:hypothetical protein ACIBL3_01375 [Kribbella sp. NPDC050124]|uniref:hypothetical protein n=1 Tax=Kribbella sp. NPDC050124 TaxID=3364114 RepID=UPI0037AC9A6B
MKFRFALSAAATVPLVLGLAACGGEPAATGYKPSTPVSTPVTTAEPQKVVPAAHLDSASFMPAVKEGMVGKDTFKVAMTMESGGEKMTITGEQSMNPVKAKIDLKGAAFGGRMKLILVNDIAYVQTSDLPRGKYLEIDPNSDHPMAAEVGKMLEDMSPTKTFDAFDAGLTRVEYIKTEALQRRKVDRYEVTVDAAAAMKAQGQKVPAGLPKAIVYTIWMGQADHLMYKMSFNLMGASATMTVSDWGKPVSIKAPAAEDIVSQ